jgi:hypothetical protein
LHRFFEEAGRAGDRLTATLEHEREADGKTGTVRPERISRRHDALLIQWVIDEADRRELLYLNLTKS